MTSEYILSIMYLNIIVYIYLNFVFFSLIFIFDTRNITTLNDLKYFSNMQFFSFSIILIFLSFAGVPPTVGFISKSLALIFIFFKKFFFFFFFISFINFFLIYFYIKNLRFLISKSKKFNFLYHKNYAALNQNLVIFINTINFINCFSLWFVEDILILIDNFSLLVNFY